MSDDKFEFPFQASEEEIERLEREKFRWLCAEMLRDKTQPILCKRCFDVLSDSDLDYCPTCIVASRL